MKLTQKIHNLPDFEPRPEFAQELLSRVKAKNDNSHKFWQYLSLSLLLNIVVIVIIAFAAMNTTRAKLDPGEKEVALRGFDLNNTRDIEVTVFDILNSKNLGVIEPTTVANEEIKFNIKTGVYLVAVNENNQTIHSQTVNVTSFSN
jgi:hypothetical protein